MGIAYTRKKANKFGKMYASDKLIRQTTKGSVKLSTLEGKVTTEPIDFYSSIKTLHTLE